jgi:hypothetical protein
MATLKGTSMTHTIQATVTIQFELTEAISDADANDPHGLLAAGIRRALGRGSHWGSITSSNNQPTGVGAQGIIVDVVSIRKKTP